MVSNRVMNLSAASQAGGVSVAIHDALVESDGFWFGWNGQIDDMAADESAVTTHEGHTTVTVPLSPEDYNDYYLGYSNSVLWPVFHNRLDLAQFEAGFYARYVDVNRRFATVLATMLTGDDIVWIHDYHLIPLAAELRRLGLQNPIGFFLHIPVGPAQALLAIPEHQDLSAALAAYDLIGVQTHADVRNLIDFLQQSVAGRILPSGSIRVLDHELEIACFPVGINPDDFSADESATTERDDQTARIIGIDRLDYTKGLPQKFKAYGKFLETYPDWRRLVSLSQFAPPTRESVEAYADIRGELESLSGSINGRYGELDWVPINYIHRSIPRSELTAVYRSCRVGWVTPLRDGMNLVAKEYVAAQMPEEPGVLILSKFAGAAEQMREAILVNPYDLSDMVNGLSEALVMPKDERRSRNEALAARVRKDDSEAWSTGFLRALRRAGKRRTHRSSSEPPQKIGEALEKLTNRLNARAGRHLSIETEN